MQVIAWKDFTKRPIVCRLGCKTILLLTLVLMCFCMQRSLGNAEEEVKYQQDMCNQLHSELTTVAEKCEQQGTEVEELNEKLRVICLHVYI